MNTLVLLALVAGDMPPAGPVVVQQPAGPVIVQQQPAAMPGQVGVGPAPVAAPVAAGCDGCGAPAAPCSTCEEKPNLLSKLRARFGSGGSRWKGKKSGDCGCPPACDCAPAPCALPPAPTPVIVAPPTSAPTIMPTTPNVITPAPSTPGVITPVPNTTTPADPKKETEKKSSKLTVPPQLVVPAGSATKPQAPLGGAGSPF
jgi:hypothetical protein